MSPEDTKHDLDPNELSDRLRKLRAQFDELRRRL
jgi:hypothetical protein